MEYPSAVASAMWVAIEPFAGAGLMNADVRAAMEPYGLSGRSAFFAVRTSPLGAVSPRVVAAVCHGFSVSIVEESVAGMWERLTPGQAIDLSHGAFTALATRVWADAYPVDSLRETTEVLARVIAELDVAGKPLAAGNQAVPLPDEPWARLWRCVTTLREYRGDSHVGALVSHDLSSTESQVLGTVWRPDGYDVPMLQRSRGIDDEAWVAAHASLHARGLLDAEGDITAEGQRVRDQVEHDTDVACMRIWSQLTPAELTTAHSLLLALSMHLFADRTEAPRGAVAMPWPPPPLTLV